MCICTVRTEVLSKTGYNEHVPPKNNVDKLWQTTNAILTRMTRCDANIMENNNWKLQLHYTMNFGKRFWRWLLLPLPVPKITRHTYSLLFCSLCTVTPLQSFAHIVKCHSFPLAGSRFRFPSNCNTENCFWRGCARAWVELLRQNIYTESKWTFTKCMWTIIDAFATFASVGSSARLCSIYSNAPPNESISL